MSEIFLSILGQFWNVAIRKNIWIIVYASLLMQIFCAFHRKAQIISFLLDIFYSFWIFFSHILNNFLGDNWVETSKIGWWTIDYLNINKFEKLWSRKLCWKHINGGMYLILSKSFLNCQKLTLRPLSFSHGTTKHVWCHLT